MGQYSKKKKRRGPKRKVTKKPSQEMDVTPDGPLISSKEINLNVEKETSENNVPITHAHAPDAGQAWATQDDIGQRVPSKYNLRNAGAPVSYAHLFDEMDEEVYPARQGRPKNRVHSGQLMIPGCETMSLSKLR